MTAIVDFLNTVLWGHVLVYGLLAVGLWFTWITGFVQFRRFGEFFRVIAFSRETTSEGISPFQALTVSLASRVGTGNLAGVAVAIHLGGPGAIFWMWMVALVGMATAYAESTLAQLYKVRNAEGQYRGGPAFYMARGIGSRAMGYVFSICLILSFGLIFSAVQANSISVAMEEAFAVPRLVTGLGVGALAGVVILGGIRSIARVAEKVVPAMAGAYILLAVVVVGLNVTEVPGVLVLIVKSAFGFEAAAGGFTGGIMAALLNGVKRGLFSNEAGMGSAPNIAAVAVPDPHHPASQGMVQGLGVFIDTLVICTATALMILLSGAVDHSPDAPTGMALTQIALEGHVGALGPVFVAAAILFFAFTSIIGNYSYAESAMEFLGLGGRGPLMALKLLVVAMVVWGSLQAVTTVFDIADASMAVMATVNLVAIAILSRTVAKLTRDYFAQRRAGDEPVFRVAEYPELGEGVDRRIWNRETAERAQG
ncbi:alanine:cation symporter family protein [Palleronia sediminis]|uniref:Alanine:cation symporter family protein n=1 Tax=Palleronia sediminis TaxID=2547833 RepID=A0A4R6A771_9RHOB|nr:alanine/glycine:cation symporter family protein [Palleronia sediminis]TDL79500.1 alanine:cation symporter family protein [Palleronia sediminis]